MLQEQRRKQLDGIVAQMAANNEPDSNIRFVVDDFKGKYENEIPTPQTQPKQPFATRASAFVGGKGISDLIGAGIARTGATGLTKAERAQVSFPTGKEVAGSTLQLGLTLSPMARAASTLGKVAVGAATGLGFDVGGKLQQNKSGAELVTPGLGAAVGGALPLLGKITGLTGLGQNLGAASKKLEEINLRLTPTEKQNLEKQGKDIVSYLAEKRVVGNPQTRYAKVTNLYNDMEEKVSKAIADAKVTYKTSDIIEDLKSVPEQFTDDLAGHGEAVSKVSGVIKTLQENFPETIDGTRLNILKRKLFERAYSKNNTDVINDTLNAIAQNFNGKLRAGVKGLEAMNKEYGTIITARRALFKAQSRKQTGLIGRALGITAGTAVGGGVGGGIGAAAGAVIGERAASSVLGTATRSGTGALLGKLGQQIDKLPTDAAGNISKKALQNLIQSFQN